ncbi:YitT family protein [Radiobacillus kanasensis]|uniref:YczE/YyaS/YitT family protein n=1 Tax=Radiobacillus kanasensis TaxID=2844358 RepID=UPI001E45C478|nr:YitT family protein [Radiobacillus kanasensis]UFT98275.1 YitT family protein [Radiobacillus kanasensis]
MWNKLKEKQVHYFVIGIAILTLGITLCIQSTLGTSPFDALLVGLYRTIGLTVGTWEIIIGFVMILTNAILMKNRPEFLALVTSFVTGVGIDSWLWIFRDWLIPSTLLSQFICLSFGIIFTGIGVATYLQSKLAPIPFDRSMLVVSKLTGWSFVYSRGIINILLVILAFFFHGPIGIGTLLNALVTGVIIKTFFSYMEKLHLHKKAKRSIA